MNNNRKVNVAIIGLGFGAEFIPIYQSHQNANMYAICRRDESELEKLEMRLALRKVIRIIVTY